MSQRRLETFPDLPRPLGTSRTSYKKSYFLTNKIFFVYDVLGVPRGLGRSGNVSKRLWDVLELLYIEFVITLFPAPLVCGMAIVSGVRV